MEGFERFGPVWFDAENHIYRFDGTGERLPSVTEILRVPGKSWYLPGSSERGHAVHSLTELFDKGEISVEDCPELYRGYLRAWALFRRESGFTPEVIEGVGLGKWNGKLYSGKVDRVGMMRLYRWTVDIKSGAYEKKHIDQLGGYHGLRGLDENGKELWSGANKLALVYLKNDGTYKTRLLDDAVAVEAVQSFDQALASFKAKG